MNPKVNQVVEIIVEEDSEYESTYTSFIQEDIINEYENSGRYKNTSFEEYTEILKDHYSDVFGRKVDIRPNTSYNIGTNGKNELGRQGQIRQRAHYNFEDEQNRAGNHSESGESTKGIKRSISENNEMSSNDGIFC